MIRTFQQIGSADLPAVGGKGVNLGVLFRAGFPVPPGFCVTTKGFAGSSCREASRFIEKTLGQRTGERLTNEFHVQQTQQQSLREGA